MTSFIIWLQAIGLAFDREESIPFHDLGGYPFLGQLDSRNGHGAQPYIFRVPQTTLADSILTFLIVVARHLGVDRRAGRVVSTKTFQPFESV